MLTCGLLITLLDGSERAAADVFLFVNKLASDCNEELRNEVLLTVSNLAAVSGPLRTSRNS